MKMVKVVAAIICDKEKILVTQRGYGEFKDGWEFPGGKVEPNETNEEAIVREIKEELDMEIEVQKYLDTVEHDYPTFHLSMDCFVCSIKEGTPVMKEHEAMKWITIDELNIIDLLPADIKIIDKINNYFNQQ